MVEWETGETTYAPLDLIASDYPVTCAEYAMKHGLLDTPGWKRFNRYAKIRKKMQRMINQAKLQSYRRDPCCKFGILVPQNHKQAVEIDKRNRNTFWQHAAATEMRHLLECNTIIDKDKGRTTPMGYKRIQCHMIYDVKHYGRRKARPVADGHLADSNTETVYSGVISLRGIRLAVFLAKLNALQLWGADIGNAYHEVPVSVKRYMDVDNQSVKRNIAIPHASLKKQHNTLAYHCERELIAAKVLGYYWINGKNNPADIVSKHWGYQQVWQFLKPLLFYSGNTIDLIEEDRKTVKNIKESTASQESL
jgi:hypothetical protein